MSAPSPPPRSKAATPSGHAQHTQQPKKKQQGHALSTLLAMGFPKARAEKALASTGFRSAQIASDWLLAHARDPDLDKNAPRMFALYLCPSDDCALSDGLRTFWNASKTQIGWNGAHAAMPHITLTTSFACPDARVEELVTDVTDVADNFSQDFRSRRLHLERYASPNYFGLFVAQKDESLLRSLSHDLACAASDTSCARVDSRAKSFHVTLAYQFPGEHAAGLEDLSAGINPEAIADWELRLYSFEERMLNNDVYKVLFRHMPREDDELELLAGDCVYISPEAVTASSDGWVFGTSWLTGCSGFLPKNHVRQTAKTDAWTLHLCLPMSRVSKSSSHRLEEKDRRSPSVRIRLDSTSSSSRRGTRAAEGAASAAAHRTDLEVESLTLSAALPVSSTSTPTATLKKHSADRSGKSPRPRRPRRVFIARHGERVDFTFGTWIPFCFENGRYVQKDLNMPATIPRRLSGPEGFARDCPLTHIGMVQARLLGNSLLKSGVTFSHAFTSPALRCVQTCHHILEGMNLAKSVKMRLEPGLFEWLSWYQNAMPEWMSAEELSEAGFNMDEKWKPFIGSDELQDTQESREQFYTRNFFVTQCILQATEESASNLLFVGHAATLEVCTRQITGQSPRSLADFMNVVRRAPYCSLAVMEEQMGAASGGAAPADANPKAAATARPASSWRVVEPPSGVWPITHSGNSRYDWKMLVEAPAK